MRWNLLILTSCPGSKLPSMVFPFASSLGPVLPHPFEKMLLLHK